MLQAGKNIESLKSSLSADPHVVMHFISHGNDGLKVMFQLSDKCYDHGKYSLFYKVFARKFSQQYQLDQVLDPRTSDETRACFISIDPDAFYNGQAETVGMENYIDFENPDQVRDLRLMLRDEDQLQVVPVPGEEKDKQAIDDDVLNKIKATHALLWNHFAARGGAAGSYPLFRPGTREIYQVVATSRIAADCY